MKEKLRASAIHVIISLLIGSICASIVFLIWYPYPLAKAVGVTHIFLMLLAIDIIIGPLLTFLIYKKGKKTLKLDLFCIGLIQIFALCYGMWTVYQGKPAWLVFNADRFDVVRIIEIDKRKINQVKDKYRTLSLFSPKWVASIAPQNIDENNDILFEAVFAGIDIAQRPELYQDLNDVKDKIKNKAQGLELLNNYNNKKDVEKTLAKYPKADAWLPLKANAIDMVVLINKETASVIKIVDLRPWK